MYQNKNRGKKHDNSEEVDIIGVRSHLGVRFTNSVNFIENPHSPGDIICHMFSTSLFLEMSILPAYF